MQSADDDGKGGAAGSGATAGSSAAAGTAGAAGGPTGGTSGAAGAGAGAGAGAAGKAGESGAAGVAGAAGNTTAGAGGAGTAGTGAQGGTAGTTAQGGAAGTSGQGGTAGTSAQGGTAGTTAQGGSAGTTAQGGSAGTTAQGGSAGAGGQDQGCPTMSATDPTHHQFGAATATPIITADETWKTDHVYFILSTFGVRGSTLTIEEGARVCLSPGSGTTPTIFVDESGAKPGRVVIKGTAARPVVFDRATPLDQYSGFAFDGKSEAVFDHVVFRHGGFGGQGVLRFSQVHPQAAVLRDVHLEDFFKVGLSTPHPTGLSNDSRVFVDSQQANSAEPIVRASLGAVSTFTATNLVIAPSIPARTRAIALVDGAVEKDLTLTDALGADYVVPSGNLSVQQASAGSPIPKLTLEAGTHVRFSSGELVIGDSGSDNDGSLIVNGTAAKPVVLSGNAETPARGDWSGVVVYPSGLGVSKLSHLTIEDAGGAGGTSVFNCRAGAPVQAALKLRSSGSGPYAGPTIDNVKVVRSGGDALAFSCTSSTCLSTDYASAVSGSDNAGGLLQALGCP